MGGVFRGKGGGKILWRANGKAGERLIRTGRAGGGEKGGGGRVADPRREQ